MALNVIINPETDETFFDSIRRLLGGADESELENDDIVDPAFFDMAEMELLTLVPCLDSTDVTTTDKTKARLAMIHLIAAKLCPTMKGKSEYEVKTIDVSWKKKPVDYDTLQENLLGTVDSLLNTITCYSGDGTDSIAFRIAPSKRAVEGY